MLKARGQVLSEKPLKRKGYSFAVGSTEAYSSGNVECHQKEVMASYSFGSFCRHFSENASKRKTFYFNLSHGCQTVEMN